LDGGDHDQDLRVNKGSALHELSRILRS
jgi:hypothetical protein